MKYEKLIQDGHVAVLISPDFGAGISTWASNEDDAESILFDREIIQLVLDDKINKAIELCEIKYPDVYTGGFDQAEISWIPVGQLFRVRQYDGNESIEFYSDDKECWNCGNMIPVGAKYID